jgi:hypothetical protein
MGHHMTRALEQDPSPLSCQNTFAEPATMHMIDFASSVPESRDAHTFMSVSTYLHFASVDPNLSASPTRPTLPLRACPRFRDGAR